MSEIANITIGDTAIMESLFMKFQVTKKQVLHRGKPGMAVQLTKEIAPQTIL